MENNSHENINRNKYVKSKKRDGNKNIIIITIYTLFCSFDWFLTYTKKANLD